MPPVILPRSWHHWCPRYGLYRVGAPCGAWYYLKGLGRHWRVTDAGMFQCGDTYANFDRWALCSPIYETELPKTSEEFIDAVLYLLGKHNDPS